jgi:Predicted membrane protein (DUF2142)
MTRRGGGLAGAAAAAILLACFAGLALAYRQAIPLFEAPDEPSHLHHAVFVYEQGRLPRQQPAEVPGEGMQPPLVYVAAAPLVGRAGLDASLAASALHAVDLYVYGFDLGSPGGPSLAFAPSGRHLFRTDGSLRALAALRATSAVFGLVAVALTFAAGWRLRGDAGLALLAAAPLAFDPQFLFVAGYFNNDSAAAAVAATALWVVVDAVRRGGPAIGHFAAGGGIAALGILTKTSTVPALAVAAATLLAIDRRVARWRDAVIALAVALIVAGPYLFWAAVHRGGFMGVGALYASASELHVPAGERLHYLTGPYWLWTFQSYWCRFGWMNVPVPTAIYAAFFALVAAGVLGSALAGRLRRSDPPAPRSLRTYLFASVAATLAAHVALNATVVSAQGRQLFGIAPQLALLLALGLDRIAGNARRALAAAVGIATALAAIDVYCLRALSAAY